MYYLKKASNLKRPSFGNANNGGHYQAQKFSIISRICWNSNSANKQPSLKIYSITISNNGNTSGGITSAKSNSQYYSIGSAIIPYFFFSNKSNIL